jgi:hypothetical protein
VFAGEAGIALLDAAEEALLGGEEETLAVDVDGAAFEDDAAAVPEGEFGLEPAARAASSPARSSPAQLCTWPSR